MTRKRYVMLAFVSAWLGAVAGGASWLLGYDAVPGGPGGSSICWPADSGLRPVPGQFNLFLFAHPHCPCTRAGLAELTWVLDRSCGKVETRIVFVIPPGAPEGWGQKPVASDAVPGVRVVSDDGGREAAAFGAVTSGQVLLFDPEGRLVFRGGITAGRGHRGDNPGRRAVLDLIQGARNESARVPGLRLPAPGRAEDVR